MDGPRITTTPTTRSGRGIEQDEDVLIWATEAESVDDPGANAYASVARI